MRTSINRLGRIALVITGCAAAPAARQTVKAPAMPTFTRDVA